MQRSHFYIEKAGVIALKLRDKKKKGIVRGRWVLVTVDITLLLTWLTSKSKNFN